MLKVRALSFALFVGAATLLTGCFEDVKAPRIKGLAVNPAQLTDAGSQIQGAVEFDTDKASVSFRVTSGGADATGSFSFSGSSSLSSSPATLGTIKPNGAVTEGAYTLTVTVTDDEGNSTTERAGFAVGNALVVTDLGNNNGDNTRTLGAQGNSTEGSFLDVDAFKVYKSGAKTDSEKSSIDIVLFASPNTTSGILMLMSPKEAAAQGLGGVASWGAANLNSTIIAKASGPITTREAAITAIGVNTSEKAEAQLGATYALKLSNDIYASLTIQGISGPGNTASATLTILSD